MRAARPTTTISCRCERADWQGYPSGSEGWRKGYRKGESADLRGFGRVGRVVGGCRTSCACAGAGEEIHTIILPNLPTLPLGKKRDVFTMNYGNGSGGRIDRHPSEAGRVSYDDVIERLIEAWGFLRRMPDRERGWLRDPRSPWPEIMRHSALGDFTDLDPDRNERPRLPGLRSAEVDRMNMALSWIEAWTPERDRKLIGLVLAQLERGENSPPWRAIAKKLGWAGHPDTLTKRFDRAVATIAAKLNLGANPAKMTENRT